MLGTEPVQLCRPRAFCPKTWEVEGRETGEGPLGRVLPTRAATAGISPEADFKPKHKPCLVGRLGRPAGGRHREVGTG